MSSSAEILAVFNDDIQKRSKIVRNRKDGDMSFFSGLDNFSVYDIFPYQDELIQIIENFRLEELGLGPDALSGQNINQGDGSMPVHTGGQPENISDGPQHFLRRKE